MRVSFLCGYYSDLAHKINRRTEPYWDAYFFTWAVKMGSFRRPFLIHGDNGASTRVTADNFNIVRPWFGAFIANVLQHEHGSAFPLLIPVPSKDAVLGEAAARSTVMVQEAMRSTPHDRAVAAALSWRTALTKAHQGGIRGREYLKQHLVVSGDVRGRDVVLIDDLLSKGGTMLASAEVLTAAGANVLGAVVCGKTIYDFGTKNFGWQNFELTQELSDFHGA